MRHDARKKGQLPHSKDLVGAAPVLAAMAAAVLANLLVLPGAVFSVDPVTPKASNVNPAEGFKRLFKAKQLVELVEGVLKLVL